MKAQRFPVTSDLYPLRYNYMGTKKPQICICIHRSLYEKAKILPGQYLDLTFSDSTALIRRGNHGWRASQRIDVIRFTFSANAKALPPPTTDNALDVLEVSDGLITFRLPHLKS
ncbi:MAG: hypothetical protein SFY80_10175 [Verrucomicrobiota bacterium]|nr:hypothetical protein [Verrucomicrobiota bacterium]